VARLIAGADRKLTLVCAPAGWGKTVLLSEWHAAEEESRPFAWVQLDPSDDDPVRLWSYVIGALRTVGPELGAASLAALQAARPALVEVVLPPLLNELAALRGPIVLVLDDYNLVRDERVHESIAFLLRHLPRTTHLAIASRADPPLPLGSLRAAGDVNELRVAELRFSHAEADALLNGSLGLGLDAGDVGLLQARTEGWPAGLQLAALSARGHEDKRAFVEAFAGDDRQIVDYLHEIVEAQPPELRDFLVRTSVLDTMCAPLCDAVTGREDGRERLQAAERANLFLVALDSRGDWYRYHQLFRDLLRHELARSDAALTVELHHRASAWYREHGDAGDAIYHATAAGDFDDACDLVARHWGPVWNLGQRETVARWIDALPSDVVLDDARVCLARAWTALFLGAFAEVERWARAAELARLRGPFFDGSASVAAVVARLRSVQAYFEGDVGHGIEQGRLAVTLSKEEDPQSYGPACVVLGVNLSLGGDPEEAAGLLAAALPSLVPPRWVDARLAALGRLTSILAEAGELERAARTAADARRLVHELALHEIESVGIVHFGHGKLFELRGETEAAATEYARAIALARRGGRRLDLAQALLALALLERRRRRHEQARSLAREARGVLALCPDPGMLTDLLARTERALQLTPARRPVPALATDAELSERELTVLRLLASDLSRREIGAELYVSVNTVKGHVRSIFHKLDVSSRADAVARGRELGHL
jgi:LuxR family maltose regulon positive regulatory protein